VPRTDRRRAVAAGVSGVRKAHGQDCTHHGYPLEIGQRIFLLKDNSDSAFGSVGSYVGGPRLELELQQGERGTVSYHRLPVSASTHRTNFSTVSIANRKSSCVTTTRLGP
jgi:hypothetical protein